MAKKKVTHQGKPPQCQEQTHQTTAAMEEASEKLESLKSLNSMLLKETVERRQQVDSLQQSNGLLESKLTRSKMEKKEFESELTRLSDRTVMMELERNLVFVFVAVQVNQQAEMIEKERDAFGKDKMEIEKRLGSLEREMGVVLIEKNEIEKVKSDKECEIGLFKKKLSKLVVEIDNEKDVSNRVTRERDEMRIELDVQIEEANGFKLKLIETERRKKVIQEEVGKLRVEYDSLVEEKKERERTMELIIRDRDSAERSVMESHRVIEEMNREIDEMVRDKEAVEAERNEQVTRRKELENVVTMLNETVLSLQKEEQKLRTNVAVLERRCDEGVEKGKQMVMEIGVLVEENKERENSLENLIDEKSLVMKDLDKALKQLDEQEHKVEEITKEKSKVREAKEKEEKKIVELQKQVAEFKGTIISLEESCRGQMEKMKGLASEVSHYRSAFDRVTTERDEARKGFNDEKTIGMKLWAKIVEMEKSIEETHKMVGKMKDEKSKLIGQKKELESGCSMLKKDLASVENKLAEAGKEFDDMEAKAGLADINLELILNMLRNTATLVSQSKEENEYLDQLKAGEEIRAYVAELEAIKNAFKSRESTVEDMKRQLVSLQNSEAAYKRKSFWTLLTSATTICAAASVAYVARGH